MKAICDRAALVDIMNLASGMVAQRTPKPVLQCVRVEAQKDSLHISAMDSDASVQLQTARVEVKEPGAVLIPADKFNQIVRESSDTTLAIESDREHVNIRGQDSRFSVFGYPVDEYPALPTLPTEVDFEIAAGELHRLISMTVFATARENSRYAINGVLMEREKNKLVVVATDGHRLALARGSCQGGSDQPCHAIVPTRSLNLLLRLFENDEQQVKVCIADNQILFATEDGLLVSKLQEGNFPPYRDVIPKDGDRKATLDTQTLMGAVRRAALLTNEESKGVRMSFDGKQLILSSRAPEMGEAEVRVDVAEYIGEPVDIGFNPGYLLDALKVIEDPKVHLELKASNKPGVLRTGPNFLYVIMPVSLP